MESFANRMSLVTEPPRKRIGTAINLLQAADTPIHGWYRFVLSYPPHLVRKYIEAFGLASGDRVLDPFCGTGTTLVEAKKLGLDSVGADAHPVAAMVSRVKISWELDTAKLRRRLASVVAKAERETDRAGLLAQSFEAKLFGGAVQDDPLGEWLSEEEVRLIPTGFVSSRPLQRLLILRRAIMDALAGDSRAEREFFLVAMAHVIANGAGNFAFGPEIYRTKPKPDYDVLGHFAVQAGRMITEMKAEQIAGRASTPARVVPTDARMLAGVPGEISAVITSPPYPNEKDYTRTTRVELVLLGLVSDREDLRGMKEGLLRSNTRNVFVADTDNQEVSGFDSVQKICRAIEDRRVELNKTSGFERLYHKVVAHYFGGMRRHFRNLHPLLNRRAPLAYVVGDQLSFLMVHVPTAQLLGEIAEAEGFRVTGCDLWRERVGTKVRNSRTDERTVRVREEVLLLEKK